MIAQKLVVAALAGLALCCSKKGDASPSAAGSAEKTSAPAPSVAGAGSATPGALPASAGGAPKQSVKGEGIELTESSDGSVVLKASATWGEPLDTTYENCEYFRNAIPVLTRQLAPERAKLLSQVCATAPK